MEAVADVDYAVSDYLTPDLARAAVASLTKSEINYTVRVIDAFASKLSYAEVMNGAFEESHAPIVCALNADVECRGSQQPILDIFDEFPDVAVVGPLQVNGRGIVVHGGIFGSNVAPVHRCWGEPVDFHPELRERIEDAVSVSGSVYYARRAVWDELGGFLETDMMYYEETFFSYLARHRGYRVVYTGEACWLHHWNSSPLTDQQKGERFEASRVIFRRACAREGIACD